MLGDSDVSMIIIKGRIESQVGLDQNYSPLCFFIYTLFSLHLNSNSSIFQVFYAFCRDILTKNYIILLRLFVLSAVLDLQLFNIFLDLNLRKVLLSY